MKDYLSKLAGGIRSSGITGGKNATEIKVSMAAEEALSFLQGR